MRVFALDRYRAAIGISTISYSIFLKKALNSLLPLYSRLGEYDLLEYPAPNLSLIHISKIQEAQIQQHNEGIAAQRKSIVGSGDRSEKIRTYNFPQNRLTDHRINLTLYNLDVIMDGYIDDIIEKLRVADNAEKMKGQTESV